MYLGFYDLRSEPFRLTPDPHFFHLADPHRKALTVLLQGVLRRKGTMVVTGPIGTGKTTVLNALLMLTRKLPPPQKVLAAFLVNPLLNPDEFLEAVLADFEVPCSSSSRPQRLMALNREFHRVYESGGTSVLIIDEAHLLSAELLEQIRLLGNMDTHREQLLQVILCGQPELASTLLHAKLKALRQRIALMTQLRSFNQEETRRYVEDRMRYAGLHGPMPFTAPAMEGIHNATQGVPRLINLVCDNALVLGFTRHQRQIGTDLIQQAAAELLLSPGETRPSHQLELEGERTASAVNIGQRASIRLAAEFQEQR